MMTTYPDGCDGVGDANSSGFQRKLQSSPQAPCGPPWMRNFTGYFLEASKFGGFTSKPSTLSLCAPVNQNDSSGDMATWERTASFKCVSCEPLTRLLLCGCMSLTRHASEICTTRISVGCSSDIFVKTRDLPSGLTTGSSLNPGRRSI